MAVIIDLAPNAVAYHNLAIAQQRLGMAGQAAANEQGLFRQMLKVIMDALPRADAAGIVRIPPGCPPGERRLAHRSEP